MFSSASRPGRYRPLRGLALVSWIATSALAGSSSDDEVHPRASENPLKVTFTPWYCTTCIKEKRIQEKPREFMMLNRTVEVLDDVCKLGRRWSAIKSPHFKILSSLEAAKVSSSDSKFVIADLKRLRQIFPKRNLGRQGVVLNAHQRAHLYHIRLERLYAHFSALTNNTRRQLGMAAPYEVFLFGDSESHRVLAGQILGKPHHKRGLRHQVTEGSRNFLVFTTAEDLVKGGDGAFHSHIRHHVAHNLADGYGSYSTETGAWLSAGIAHYYERREASIPNTVCDPAETIQRSLGRANWVKKVRHLVQRGKDRSLALWCEEPNPIELNEQEHLLSWSVVDWMIRTDPLRFTRLLDKRQDRKTNPTGAESITHAYGVSPDVLHRRWREYVRKEYKRRKD